MNLKKLLNFRLQGCADIHCAMVLWKSSPSPPPPPDYAGAANATAQGNLEAARAAASANRVNQVTPYGNLTYSRDPNAATPDDGWTATQSLAPTQQALLDQQNKTSLGLSALADRGLGYVEKALSNNITEADLPEQSTREKPANRLYCAAFNR